MTSGDLDPQARKRIEDLFHRAVELPADQRPEFVRRECADSPAIAAEVLSLLNAHELPDQFLDSPIPAEARVLMDDAARADALVGQQLRQYRVNRILGQGGMGVVYEAWDSRLHRSVALKAISADVAADPVQRERLHREAIAASPLNHPGIAIVYAFEEFGDEAFIAGELVQGKTLRDEMSGGALDPARVLQTATELAQALAAAHDHGVIHRDLKPENVMRTPDGRVKILDFGLARLRHAAPEETVGTGTGAVYGTPAYMAPEQHEQEKPDARSDLFSLGIVLYELLAGTHPFGGVDRHATILAIRNEEPRPFRADRSSQPVDATRAGLEGIIQKLLRKSTTARFASAHELVAALEGVRSGQITATPASQVSASSDAVKWWKFHQAAMSAFYVLLLVPIGLSEYLMDNDDATVPLFLAILVVVAGAVTLRLHLMFTVTSMPDQFNLQHQSAARWMRVTDWLMVLATAATGAAGYRHSRVLAVILLIGAVTSLIASTVIEPATTRAAFGKTSGD